MTRGVALERMIAFHRVSNRGGNQMLSMRATGDREIFPAIGVRRQPRLTVAPIPERTTRSAQCWILLTSKQTSISIH